MAAPVPAADRDLLARWCADQLGSPPVAKLWRSGNLAEVIGLRLADGREVVVKIRPAAPRLNGCAEVQRRLFQAGYPCPEPLAGPAPLSERTATAEVLVSGGTELPAGDRPVRLVAAALARLIALAPRPDEVPSLDPAPSWAGWDHSETGLWPVPDDCDADLNAVPGPGWLDEAARLARDRLRTGRSTPVIGHCDWLAGNLRWTGDELLVVHDWDSACVDSEDVFAGLAAALFSEVGTGQAAVSDTAVSETAVSETGQFLDAYGEARGRPLTDTERRRAWAAGVWTRAYDAKCQYATGQPVVSLSETEARERLRRAGIDLS